jgi:hypothetical protein
LRKGLVVGDPDMPEFRFSDDASRDLISYLKAIQAGIVVEAPAAPSAEARISFDPGGKIAEYNTKYSDLAKSGRHVVIDGPCASACTLILGIVPLDRFCITWRSTFGFHMAWGVDDDGRPIADPLATQRVLDTYPKPLRDWIVKNGGLTAHMRYLSATQLRAIIPGLCFRSSDVIETKSSCPRCRLHGPEQEA